MSGIINFHRIAAARGDGLHPRLLELLEQRSARVSDPKLAELSAHHATGFTQSGPMPLHRDHGWRPDNVIDFRQAVARLPEAVKKTSSQ